MVEFLLDLPEGDLDRNGRPIDPWPAGARQKLRARLDLRTTEVSSASHDVAGGIPRGLTPLQLATFLGHKAVVTRILRRHMLPLWKWGPQSEKHLFLGEIDSAAEGANQVVM